MVTLVVEIRIGRAHECHSRARVDLTRLSQLIEPKRAGIVVDSCLKTQRVDHPGGPFRSQRQGMFRVPIRRQRQPGFTGINGQSSRRNRDLQKIKINIPEDVVDCSTVTVCVPVPRAPRSLRTNTSLPDKARSIVTAAPLSTETDTSPPVASILVPR